MENLNIKTYDNNELSDDEIIKLLPGFTNQSAKVNGVHLHYVIGGTGQPLILIPGWPQTWWAYHKIIPILATHYQVIVIDIRGMGSSEKPSTGYEKKNMAKDVFELVQHLGFEKMNIGGHDVGAHVAFSFAANYPDSTCKLILFDTPHPDSGMYHLPMLPALHTGDQDNSHIYPWWLAFNQVKNLPEQLLLGRVNMVHDYVFKYVCVDETCISPFDRAVYAAAYDHVDGIRAGNAWYQAFPQDIEDIRSYKKLNMPVLGIGGSGYEMLQMSLPNYTTDLKLAEIKESGHFIFEEKPEETTQHIIDFLG